MKFSDLNQLERKGRDRWERANRGGSEKAGATWPGLSWTLHGEGFTGRRHGMPRAPRACAR